MGTRGLVRSAAAFESASGLFVAILVAVGWYGAGSVLLHGVDGRWPRASPGHVATAGAFGAGMWSLVWFFLGLGSGYRAPVASAALVVGVILAGFALIRSRGNHHISTRPRVAASVYAPGVLITAAVAAAGIAALAPPTAKDALQYHLALPKAFVEATRLYIVPDTIPSYFPLGVEMNGVWAMLAGRVVGVRVGEAAIGATLFAFLPLLLAFVYGWMKDGDPDSGWAATAAALVATAPVLYEVAGGGYVDLALALYVAIAARASARWWMAGDRRELWILALALGCALAVKTTALFSFAVLGLIAFAAARRRGVGVSAVAAALGVAAAIGCPWYVRNWVLTGSPVFPFYLDIWPGEAPGWDVARSVLFREFHAFYGGAAGPIGLLALPLRASLMGQREIAALYESVLGVGFVAGIPVVALALWRRRLHGQHLVTASVATALFLLWAGTSQLLRFLSPALPLVAVVATSAAAALAEDPHTRRWLRGALLVPATAGGLLIVVWFLTDAPMLPVAGAEPRAEYLARRLDHYPYYRIINDQLPRDARIWLIDVRRDTYHLERAFRGDYLFEDWTLRQALVSGAGADGLRRLARDAGITHVFIRHDTLFDYARSPLVNDSLPRVDNVARLSRLREFLLTGTRVLAGDQKFLLLRLDAQGER